MGPRLKSVDTCSPFANEQSYSIHNTPLYRFLVLAAVKLLKRVRPHKGRVLLVSRSLCIKYGSHIQLSEASTMRYIAKHTSIPVPKVFCAFEHNGFTYILMERICGDKLGHGWVTRSEKSKATVIAQLKQMIQEMRSLSAPEGCGIMNVNGGPLYDCRLPGPSLLFGPFRTVQDFHSHLRGGIYWDPKLDVELQELIVRHQADWPLVFTHGDLSSLNILACGDKVVGIIDWETAGWYPAYWEYTTACYVNPQNSFWRDEIDKFLDPMPEELVMEKTRRKYFGDF
ncbi:hypothetical protein PRK78_000642 [Emydomyces testavorans]|uniref:Aminoglycoside phosphotransferase domain-containing protein n=1 Tax=Emydomyces testavorans TaxID=2070801 RepID=A0AAF0IG34_9EURO|nr:hypothetical protein PRK78_000642 [Emydomyces testavorans]